MVALILLGTVFENMRTKKQKIAGQVYQLLRDDLLRGKFRNGIRVEDVFLSYSLVIKESRDYFYSNILPLLERRMSASKSLEKALGRTGTLVWRLKRA